MFHELKHVFIRVVDEIDVEVLTDGKNIDEDAFDKAKPKQGTNMDASEQRDEEPLLHCCLKCSFRTHKRDEFKEHCWRESEKLVKRGAECSLPSTSRVNSPGGAQKVRKLDQSDVAEEVAVAHPQSYRSFNVRRHISLYHSGKSQVENIITEEASGTAEEYLSRREQNWNVDHTAGRLSDTNYEESLLAAHLIAAKLCYALCAGGRARENRGTISSGVSHGRQFDISTTVATVAVAPSTVDADGTGITTVITKRGGNIEASTEGSNTAALGGDSAELM
ncbi:hypothetical protein TSMEX_009676 [Taenia solium]|eukprot:TsM_000550500 transcript=TsM_000550500 gene=TsM_000550500